MFLKVEETLLNYWKEEWWKDDEETLIRQQNIEKKIKKRT